MGSIVLPSVLRQQPQQVLQLDRGNPLTRGLISVCIGSQGYDPVTGRTFVNSVGNNRTVGPMGFGVDGRVGQAKVFPAGPSLSTGSMFVVMSTMDATTEQIILEAGPDGSFTSGVRGLRYVNGQFSAYVRNFFELLTTTTYPIGIPVPVGVSYVGAAVSMYVNGRLAASGTTSDTTSPATTFNIGGITGQTSYNVRGTIPIACLWSRELSAAENASLAENPWQLFKAPARRLWVAAPSAVTAASLAWTEGADTMAITSVVTDRGALAWTEQGDTAALLGSVASPAPDGTTATMAWAEAGDTAAVAARLTNRAALGFTETGDTWTLGVIPTLPPGTPPPNYYLATIMRQSTVNLTADLGPAIINLTSGFP